VTSTNGWRRTRRASNETIGPVVAFFHRPWKALCDFRGRFAKRVLEQKQRLSELAGTWKLEQDRRDAAESQRLADEAAQAERARLAAIEEEARKAAASVPAASPLREVLEQTAVQAAEAATHVVPMPLPASVTSRVPQTSGGTRGRKQWEAVLAAANATPAAVVAAEDAFYEALARDRTRRGAAPIDWTYLNRQATDLKEQLGERFPGIVAREKGGLTAGGRR
jgi:hypothetical protein